MLLHYNIDDVFVRLNVAEDDLVAANGGMGTPGHGYLSRADQEDGSQ